MSVLAVPRLMCVGHLANPFELAVELQ
jgi:hypothetical protein